MSTAVRWCLAALLLAGAAAERAAAQSCSPTYQQVVAAVYPQVMERGADASAIGYWGAQLQNGMTVKQLVSALAHSEEYRVSYITPYDGPTIVANLYRHLLAREPDPGASGWVSYGQSAGWDAVIDGFLGSQEYADRFGEHAVPGDPVTAWDCARVTTLVTPAGHSGAVRNVAQGSATAAYTTPAYVSRDVPRSVTLFYASGQAAPRGFVQLDVVDNSPSPPAKVSIRVKDPGGAWVTDEVFYAAGGGANRVAAQWDATFTPTGAYLYTAVVRVYRGDGTFTETAVGTRVIIINERWGPYGAGWSIPGLQRLYAQADGILATNGDGSAVFFASSGAGYASPAGETSTLGFDGTHFRRRWLDGSTAVFHGDGKLWKVEDRFGNATTFAYSASGKVTSITDPAGKVITFGYYACCDVLATITDPAGRTSSVFYSGDSQSENLEFRDPTGTRALLAVVRNSDKRLAAWADRAGAAWDVAYDHTGALASVTAPQVSTTDAGVTRPVAAHGSLQKAVLPAPGAGTWAAPAARVQPHEVRVTITDPRGNTTRVAVDRFGNPTRVEDPLGRATVIDRDGAGHAVRTVSPSGHTVWEARRGEDVVLRRDETTGAEVRASYEPTYHQPTHVWGSTTEVWNYYGAQGRLDSTRVGTATAPRTAFTYTPDGRVASETDPEGHGVFYDYSGNTWQNLSSVATGSVETTSRRVATRTFDDYGREAVSVSPNNDVTRTFYDLLNRPTLAVGAENDTTRYEYGPVDVWRVTDPRGQAYQFNRNALGWVESEVDPRGGVLQYRYDRAGNRTGVTNRRGQAVEFGYDALGRMTSRVAGGVTTTWSYDPADRWVQASNPESTDRVELDAAGRPLRTVTTRAGVTYTVENAFDARGLRTGLSVTGPWSGAHTAGFRYNARMQLDTLIDFGGGRTVIEHDQDGLEVMRTLPSGVWISGGHTSLHTPTDVHYAHLSLYGPLDSRFGYDANGLVAARLTPYSDYQGSGDLVREYSYDRLGRLLGFSDEAFYDQDQVCPGGQDMDPDNGACVPAGTSQFFGALSYTYDKVGNRTDGGAVIETGNRLTQFNGYALQYDADGNLVQKSRTVPAQFNQVLYWNSLGELEGATTNGVGVSYGYDGFGRRVRRSGGPEGTVRYLYDGDDLLMELDGAGSVLREYTYYPGVDNPHSVRVWANGAGGVVYHYAMEHPGHVAGLIGPGNQLAAQYEYAPWGESEYAAGVQQPLRYMARELDPGTQLYYVRNRWYDPALARFVSEDPIGLEGGINPYVYAGNSPTNATDPFGLCVVFKGATDKDHARVNKGLDEYCPIGLEVITATSRSGGRGWSGYFTAYSGTYFAANPVGRGEGGGGGGQERIKMYIEFEQFRDNELAERFIGCKEKYYISAEYGGIYGEWYMYRTDTELQIFSFHTMSVNRKVWYAGQVYTEEYGTHQARGWVNCTTGGVKWTTPPFFVTLSPP